MNTFIEIQLTLITYQSTTMTSIDMAVQALRQQDKPNILAASKTYGVNRSTLSRRFNKVTQSEQVKHQNQCLLSPQQERTLVQYINRLTEHGIPPTPAMVRNFAYDIVGNHPGRAWSHRFCKRWKSQLDSKYLDTIDSARKKADSKHSYKAYFDLVQAKIDEYGVQPSNMYNMDEKGFLIGFLTKAKRIFTKAAFEQKRLLGSMQDSNREWITVIATICANGTTIAPGLIYKAVSGNLQDSWLQDFDPKQHNVFFASSLTGWTNDELGMSYIQSIFDRETKAKAR